MRVLKTTGFHRLVLSAALFAGVLTACQPVPQPFAPGTLAPDNPLLRLADRAGVVVLDIDNAPPPAAAALPAAMKQALLARNIPSWTRGGNRASHFLQGRSRVREVAPGWLEIELTWDLADAGGKIVGRHVVTTKARGLAWLTGNRKLLDRLAAASAKGVAGFVQEPASRSEVAARRLYVLPVAGAPGDGSTSLRLAMIGALKRARLDVAGAIEDDGWVIAGSVALKAASDGRQDIEVVWAVLRPDGTELGRLNQRNAVAAGSLDGRWGELAYIIAEAAAGRVAELLSGSRASVQRARIGGE